MLIIERKTNETIDRMVKRYKNKHRSVKLRDELRARKQFVKPSVKRRMEIISTLYSIKKYGGEE